MEEEYGMRKKNKTSRRMEYGEGENRRRESSNREYRRREGNRKQTMRTTTRK